MNDPAPPPPFGSWPSPITAKALTAGQTQISEPRFSGEDLFWLESRPRERGRTAIVRLETGGSGVDVLPPTSNVRSRVHEIGGAAYLPDPSGLFWVEDADQQVHHRPASGNPRSLAAEPGGDIRYADMGIPPGGDVVIAVRETHSDRSEPRNEIVELATGGSGSEQVLVSGNDFYSSPRISPDGKRLAWLEWSHPHMPWDATTLWVADYAPGQGTSRPRRVAGGESESIFQPEWSPTGDLWFVSDRTGWWNLYRVAVDRVRGEHIEAMCPMERDFGLPQWVFGMTRYAFADSERVVAAFVDQGMDRLCVLDVSGPTVAFEEWNTGFTDVQAVTADGRGQVALVAGSAREPASLVVGALGAGSMRAVARSLEVELDPGLVSVPEHIAFPTSDGRTAYAFFYAPQNGAIDTGECEERPPLLVTSHGGPTAAASSGFSLSVQFWTSRGFALVDVNYGGSTGYGRQYRKRLEGNWGVTDVEDCLAAARHLGREGRVDPKRMAIRGKSAGGLTTLSALAFHDVFAAGASYFGVADMESLVRETHKFESHYLDSLVGPYPEMAAVYRERSPITAADRISCPVILFQGLADRIVPPSQSEAMVRTLEANRLPFAYVVFPEEGHGLRQAEAIEGSLEAELYFYGRILGFEPADDLPRVEIRHWTGGGGE